MYMTMHCNIVYVVKEVGWELGQLMDMAHNRTRARALQEESCLSLT